MTSVLIDGQPGDDALQLDRGLHYADGLFETLAWLDERPRFWEHHLARLANGCERLGIDMPPIDLLERDLATLSPAARPVILKLVITRGDGATGYAPPEAPASRRLWFLRGWPDTDAAIYARGVSVGFLDSTLIRHPVLGGLKHLGRLDSVLAARELAHSRYYEGLVCDDRGHVVEAVSSNLFVRIGDRLMTPDIGEAGVAGVMREAVLSAAALDGQRVAVGPLIRDDVEAADEAFLTNAVRGIVPVRRIGERRLHSFASAERLSRAMGDEGLMPCG